MKMTFGVDLDHEDGCLFSVWAPNAEAVFLLGDFNDWHEDNLPMSRTDKGGWTLVHPEAEEGHEYQYRIVYQDQDLRRQDPYARNVTSSVGNAIIERPPRSKKQDGIDFKAPHRNELVIYELHIGTFGDSDLENGQPATFKSSLPYLDELQKLGINAIEIMPVHEFPGGISWGYNPASLFAVESDYGSAQDLYDFIEAAHERGIAVILDVVYNHFGPSDLDLWQFDGWHENDKGGIYFYNDWRSETPWGDTRPDYGRAEVRQFVVDNALMWARDFKVDGLRFDMSVFIRTVRGIDGDPSDEISDGWRVIQEINEAVHTFNPEFITIAEDMQNSAWMTKSTQEGGAGCNAQWDAFFVHTLRDVLVQTDDAHRDMARLGAAIESHFNNDVFERVIYTESHDEVANGQARIPEEVSPGSADSWVAKRKSLLGAGIVFTAPGVPMIFQGQEFLEDSWFQDTRELDRDKEEHHSGILQAYQDLIQLRLNKSSQTRGLCAQNVDLYHLNNKDKVIVFHRWEYGGAGDSVVVVANFSTNEFTDYCIGMPAEGEWIARFNSNSQLYDSNFDNQGAEVIHAEPAPMNGQKAQATLTLPPYSLQIFSQEDSTP